MKKIYVYDVALSFAGEDRAYVEQVAFFLLEDEVKVFYDRFEEINLWGKNLYEYLSSIYKDKASYTVMFISKHYSQKLWTNHERENAQARAFKENREYILPARFDKTEVPGILDTTGYIDLNQYSPKDFAKLVTKKVKSEQAIQIMNAKHESDYEITQKTNNYIQSANPESPITQIERLISFANSESGLGMTLYNSRNWAMNNHENLKQHGINKYITDMTSLIEFANSESGLGMTIYNSRNWALTNLENLDQHGINKYIKNMTSLIKFANSESGLGMTLYNARNYALQNIDKYSI